MRSVRFVYEYDKKGLIEFAPLQGELSGRFELKGYAEKGGGSMVILREEDGKIFTKGDALLELGKTLGGVFRLLAVMFSMLPRRLRNAAYDLIARNRNRLAGACELPDEGLRKRMRN